MELSFFSALNPASDQSGITYSRFPGKTCQGKKMTDKTIFEQIEDVYYDIEYYDAFGYLSGLAKTFDILVGGHYDLLGYGEDTCQGGAKGILDYLIFPLLARKLIADALLEERKNDYALNALSWIIAIPLELTRIGVGVALTLLLAPVVTVVQIAKACLSEEKTSVPAFTR